MSSGKSNDAWEPNGPVLEMQDLREIIAENVHDTWARLRIAEGWRYGPERDDAAKTHPGLVSYHQLSESEKEYDRMTAQQTLQTVLQHGYRIIPPSQAEESSTDSADQVSADSTSPNRETQRDAYVREMRLLLSQEDSASVRAIVAKHRSAAPRDRWSDLCLAVQLIERLLEFSEPLLAFDFVTDAIHLYPSDRRLLQLQGLSLAKSGATLKANHVFRQLCDLGYSDEETLGNLARTYKSLWENSQSIEQKRTYLSLACDAYARSYRLTHGYWSGINVAFLTLMQGDAVTACRVAAEVQEICFSALNRNSSDAQKGSDPISNQFFSSDRESYWIMATIAEAFLIQQHVSDAVDWYQKATSIAGKRMGNIASTCRQARTLARHLQIDWQLLCGCFPLPKLVVFLPHTTEFGSSPLERPEQLKASLRAALGKRLSESAGMIGFAALNHSRPVLTEMMRRLPI